MTAGRIIVKNIPAIDADGLTVAGAELRAFEAGTTIPKPVYTDVGLTIPHSYPILADADGQFPTMYAAISTEDAPNLFRITIYAPDGTMLPGGSLDDVEVSVSVVNIPGLSGDDLGIVINAWAEAFLNSYTNDDEFIEGIGLLKQNLTNPEATSVQTKSFRDYIEAGRPTYLNVKDFGAVGDGVTDDTGSIQDAIYYAVENDIQTIYLPAGRYRTSSSIYLADPTFSANINAPTVFHFSLRLIGEGYGNLEGNGSWLKPDSNTFDALWVGPGQHMEVRGIAIRPDTITRPSEGIGIALAGGPGGISKALIAQCQVYEYDKGYCGGSNYDSLCDSVTLYKCDAVSCRRAYSIDATQNFAWCMIECHASYCVEGIVSEVGRQILVFGGNFSAPNMAAIEMPVTYLGNVTDVPFSSINTFAFDVQIPATPPYDGEEFRAMFASGKYYNAIGFNSTWRGEIPFDFVSFDPDTGVLRLQVNGYWLAEHYGTLAVRTVTTIEDEIAAMTSVDIGTLATTFLGAGIRAWGYHAENPNTVTTLARAYTTFAGQTGIRLERGMHNWDEDHSSYDSAIRRLQQAVPFVWAQHRNVELIDIRWARAVSLTFRSGDQGEVIVRGAVAGGGDGARLVQPEAQTCQESLGLLSQNDRYYALTTGQGRYDPAPFTPLGHIGGLDSTLSKHIGGAMGPNPYLGWRPDPNLVLPMTSAEYALLTAPIVTEMGNIRLTWGGQMYRISDPTGSDPLLVRAAHGGFSFGKTLTGANWSYKGQSHILKVANQDVYWWLVPGVRIILPKPGGGTQTLTIKSVKSGVLTVVNHDGTRTLNGTKNVTYSGSDIEQEPLSFTVLAGSSGGITQTRTTPTLALRFGGASTGITYATNTTRVTRTGNDVVIDVYMALSSKGSATGDASIGLPNTVGAYAGGGLHTQNMGSAVNGATWVSLSGQTSAGLYKTNNGVTAALNASDFNNNSVLIARICYTV